MQLGASMFAASTIAESSEGMLLDESMFAAPTFAGYPPHHGNAMELDAAFFAPGKSSKSAQKKRKLGWQPGIDVAGYIGRGRGGLKRITAQGAVLIANACEQAKSRLSMQEMKDLSRKLGGPVGPTRATSDAAQLVSSILRTRVRTVEQLWTRLRKNGFDPDPAAAQGPAQKKRDGAHASRTDGEAAVPESGAEVAAVPESGAVAVPVATSSQPPVVTTAVVPRPFFKLVRLCLHCCCQGMPKAAYPRLASLFDLSGGSLHEGNLNKFFCGLVLQVSHDLVFSATLATWLQPLPATGVRPFSS
jgi:hypothetical protein